jgi:hypothetical protein
MMLKPVLLFIFLIGAAGFFQTPAGGGIHLVHDDITSRFVTFYDSSIARSTSGNVCYQTAIFYIAA